MTKIINIFFYVKNPIKAKYQYLIRKRENNGLENF